MTKTGPTKEHLWYWYLKAWRNRDYCFVFFEGVSVGEIWIWTSAAMLFAVRLQSANEVRQRRKEGERQRDRDQETTGVAVKKWVLMTSTSCSGPGGPGAHSPPSVLWVTPLSFPPAWASDFPSLLVIKLVFHHLHPLNVSHIPEAPMGILHTFLSRSLNRSYISSLFYRWEKYLEMWST